MTFLLRVESVFELQVVILIGFYTIYERPWMSLEVAGNGGWWDGWPPHLGYKDLIFR